MGTRRRAAATGRRSHMQLGMIGLGRMGANMVRRLMRDGHRCVVYDANPAAVARLEAEGATGARSLAELAAQLAPPRAVWLMVPAATVDTVLAQLVEHLASGDTVVDGGNSYYVDDLRRARELAARGVDYLDVGVSGGVWGLERGYCLMIGGPESAYRRLEPIFRTLAPGREAAPRTPGRDEKPSTAEEGYLYCGPSGAGHFVKMVHNGIEYGLMAAYAEGFNILRHADAGLRPPPPSAEAAPLRHPEPYQYQFNLAEIAEVWGRGSTAGASATGRVHHARGRLGRRPVDGAGGGGILGAGPGADGGALRALPVARRGRLRRPAAGGAARAVRRASGTRGRR